MSAGFTIPGSWLGMLGGGQLGRMFCHAAQALGYRVAVLDPASHSPAGMVADWHLQAAYDDRQALDALAQRCVAVSTEFENVPADSLAYLARNCVTTPAARPVAIMQDRLAEKAFMHSAGVPVVPHAGIENLRDIDDLDSALFPGLLKTARLGYDGKGQIPVADAAAARQAFEALGHVPCVLEAWQALAYEISVVLARDGTGNSVAYPPARNEHRQGILAVSLIDGQLDGAVQEQARACSLQLADALDYQGVFCVEYFVLQDGRLIVNEMAPRPHNSGHYTQNACLVSQFEQQARVMAGLPLGSTEILRPAAMLNLLGDLWFDDKGQQSEPDWPSLLSVPDTCLHLYMKDEPRPGRKMGHVNILAPRADELQRRLARVLHVLA